MSLLALAASGAWLAPGPCAAASPEQKAARVQVTLRVDVPRHFQQVETVYASGSVPELGSWGARGLALSRRGSGYAATFDVDASQAVSFKLNLGDWQHAETSAQGAELPNRVLRCNTDCDVYAVAENFRLSGGAVHAVPVSASPRLRYRHEVVASAFGNQRSVAVYLPPGYDQSPGRRYPVLYALDGQNLFDTATSNGGVEWRLDETMDRLISGGDVPPTIVVGIYATSAREAEYNRCDPSGEVAGRADAYARFLLDVVKPMIDRDFRTEVAREKTALLGSSFGGNFGLYVASELGESFGRFGAMSPALWWADYCFETRLPTWTGALPERLWLDMGDREGWDDGATPFRPGVADVARVYETFVGLGMTPDEEIAKFTHVGAVHNERSWAERVDRVLRFILN